MIPTPAAPEAHPRVVVESAWQTCLSAQVATTEVWVVAATPESTALFWDRGTRGPVAAIPLPSPCRDLLAWEGEILCAVGARGALRLDPTGAQPVLLASPQPFDQLAVSPEGDLLLAYADGGIGRLSSGAGLHPDPNAFRETWHPGRYDTDLAFDPSGGIVATVHHTGTLWVGRWPDLPLLAGGTLPSGAPAPEELLFLGSAGLVVRAGGTLIQYALADPTLPVPLWSETHALGSEEAHLVALGDTVAVLRPSAGPPLLLDASGLRGWPLGGAPVRGLAPAPGGAAWALRCDGSFSLEPVPASTPWTKAPAAHAAMTRGSLADAAEVWWEIAANMLGSEPSRDLVLAAQAAVLPEADPNPPTPPQHLIALARAHLDAAQVRGAWVYPLSAADNYIQEAEALAPGDPSVIAARSTLEELAATQQRTRLRLAGVAGLLTAGIGGLWAWREIRRGAEIAAVVANLNPFRQDSPSDPQRTPFSEHPLVEDVLLGLARNCVVIEATPFSGKTALLHHLAWRLRRDGLEGQAVRVAQVPLRGVAESEFWTVLGRSLAKAATDFPGHRALLDEAPLDRFAVESFLDELWTWEEEVDYAPRRVVLVMDDLDVLGEFSDQSQRFRGLVQVLPASRLSVLGAASSLRHGWADGQLDSPWFNIFQVRDLAPFQREEVARYLERRLQPPFSYHPEVPLMLHAASRGRALHLWHLAYATVEEALLDRTTRITPHHVTAAIEAISHLIAGESTRGQDREAAYASALRRIARLRRQRDELLTRIAAQGEG